MRQSRRRWHWTTFSCAAGSWPHGLRSWGQIDGQAAFDWAFGQPDGRQRSQAVQSVLEGMATADRARALELARRLDLQDRRVATTRIGLSWSESDPVAAAQWMSDLADEEMTVTLAQNAALRYAKIDVDAAMGWAERLPAETAKTAVSAVLRFMAATDPERAAALTARIENAQTRSTTTVDVARAWGSTDPPAALRWLETADARARRQGQSEILANWVQNDPDAAMAALDAMTDVESRDTSALGMIQTLSFFDANVPDVEALYARIKDPVVRRHAAVSLHYQWAESQPALAEKYGQEAERLAAGQPP